MAVCGGIAAIWSGVWLNARHLVKQKRTIAAARRIRMEEHYRWSAEGIVAESGREFSYREKLEMGAIVGAY
jgi:hypothetical protein